MSPLKQQAMKAIKSMPENSTLEEIIERLVFISKVEEGIRQLDRGEGIKHEDAKKRFSRCLSK